MKNLIMSPSKEVRVMANMVINDVRTITGRNVRLLKKLTNLDIMDVSKEKLKVELKERELIPKDEEWIEDEIKDMLALRLELKYKGVWTLDDVEDDMSKMEEKEKVEIRMERKNQEDILENLEALCTVK